MKVEKLPEISTKDLEEIEEVLEQVAEEKLAKKAEEAEMKKLKEDVVAYKEVSYLILKFCNSSANIRPINVSIN